MPRKMLPWSKLSCCPIHFNQNQLKSIMLGGICPKSPKIIIIMNSVLNSPIPFKGRAPAWPGHNRSQQGPTNESPRMGPTWPGAQQGPTNEWARWARALGPYRQVHGISWAHQQRRMGIDCKELKPGTAYNTAHAGHYVQLPLQTTGGQNSNMELHNNPSCLKDYHFCEHHQTSTVSTSAHIF